MKTFSTLILLRVATIPFNSLLLALKHLKPIEIPENLQGSFHINLLGSLGILLSHNPRRDAMRDTVCGQLIIACKQIIYRDVQMKSDALENPFRRLPMPRKKLT